MRFFLAVYRMSTLTAACEYLRVNHTTVAWRIDRLEATLNARLFVRGNSGYEPTLAGEKLL